MMLVTTLLYDEGRFTQVGSYFSIGDLRKTTYA